MAKKPAPAIDADSLAMIEQDVKKKKARKFFLVYKGTQIKCLTVFKKGPFGPRVMKAKGGGHTGDICYGVVVGSGEKLSFMLPGNGEVASAMKCDSPSEKPPVEDAKFKKFFKDNDLKFKPSFEVVTDILQAPDPDADADEAEGPQPLAAAEPETTEVSAEPEEHGDLQRRFNQLSAGIKDFVATFPDRRVEILKVAKNVKDFLADPNAGSRDQAEQDLDHIEQLTKEAAQTAPEDLQSTVEEQPPAEDPLKKKWLAELEEVKPELRNAVQNRTGDLQKMKTTMAYAIEKANAGDYEAALKSIESLRKLFDAAIEEAGSPITAWNKVAKNAVFQIRRLQFALRGYEKELRDEEAGAPEELAAQLRNVRLGSLAIAEQLDGFVGSLQSNPEAENFIDTLKSELDSDLIIAAEKPNPFNLKVDISGPVREGLQELEAALTPAGV